MQARELRWLAVLAALGALQCAADDPLALDVTLSVRAAGGKAHALQCADPRPACVLQGGRDAISVRVKYLHFEGDPPPAPVPVLTLLADGKPLDTLATFRQTESSPPLFESDPLALPAERIKHLVVRVQVGTDHDAELTGLRVEPPPLKIDFPACSGEDTCTLARDVGQADIVVSSFAPAGTLVMLNGAIDDDADAFIANGLLSDVGTGQPREGVISVDVPARGSRWHLRARVAASPPSDELVFTLAPPTTEIAIRECTDSPCRLARNSRVGITIATELGLRDMVAKVRPVIDGVPDTTTMGIPFTVERNRLFGLATIRLPQAGDTWIAQVWIGAEEPIATEAVTLIAPSMP